MGSEVLNILEQISREKGLEKEVLVDALTSAVEAAARKKLPYVGEIHGELNTETGEVDIFSEKTVVEEVEDPNLEISLQEAREVSQDAELGEKVLVQQVMENYGRIAAQLAKQVIMQKVRDAEIDIVFNDFQDKKGELINGIVQRYEHGDLIVDLGRAEGILPRREQVFRETFNRGERIRGYVLDIRKTSKNAIVILSRTNVGLIRRLFELEVPEISEGMVEIMGIVREPNGRTKIAVKTNDRDIDAVGACVGMRGMRVQSIVQELRGEKIDIVEYSEDPQVYIKHALSPAKISRIVTKAGEKHMTIIVPDDQMSLAIGKKGQNVRLAAKLVQWRIDIKGEAEARDLLDQSGFLTTKTPMPTEDFLGMIRDAKGLGKKVVAILFAGDVVNSSMALKRDLKGLIALPNIGPKKAEVILALAQVCAEEAKAEFALKEEKMAAKLKEEAGASEKTEEIEAEEETTEAEEDKDEEEQDIPVEGLVDIDPGIIQLLISNEFQTLAELSITPLEELSAIEGISEEVARTVLAQAKERMA